MSSELDEPAYEIDRPRPDSSSKSSGKMFHFVSMDSLLDAIFKIDYVGKRNNVQGSWISATINSKSRPSRVIAKSRLLKDIMRTHFDGAKLLDKSNLNDDITNSGLSKEFRDWYFYGKQYSSFITGREERGPTLKEFKLEERAVRSAKLSPELRFRQFQSLLTKGTPRWKFEERIRWPFLKSFNQYGKLDRGIYLEWLEDLSGARNRDLKVHKDAIGVIQEVSMSIWSFSSHKERYEFAEKLCNPAEWSDDPPCIEQWYPKESAWYHPQDMIHIQNLLFTPSHEFRTHFISQWDQYLPTVLMMSHISECGGIFHKHTTDVEHGFTGRAVSVALTADAGIPKLINPRQLGEKAQRIWKYLFWGEKDLVRMTFPTWYEYREDSEKLLQTLLEETGYTTQP